MIWDSVMLLTAFERYEIQSLLFFHKRGNE
jgi:hypothetical protein